MTQLLDFKLPVAKWIAQVGVIDETQASPHPTVPERVILDAAASASLRTGKARLAHCPALLHSAGTAGREATARPSCGVRCSK